ncbi:MAG: ribosomal RNA small subunit methyltransferase A [Candidatus Tectomicrobia bacterium]|uniref:Ribosomal RNA small subunit methyltransferase A n=1 Tax=Tectimicrobiota bacterium TaxID=2528274 RepID=A0A933LQV2_UNCTE|nr:ribosomal RNA small subunit methyltransferase A [Candidatus Tectomicrobia bacterium]
MTKVRDNDGNTWRPSKSLGQNFLVDKFYINEILERSDCRKEDHVLEIGAGLGYLTFPLARRVLRVTALEKDPFLFRKLEEKKTYLSDLENVELILADALKFSYTTLVAPVKVIGNLPYSVATAILLHLITVRNNLTSIYITIQREVAEKILAKPGQKDYGSLSIYVQYYFEGAILFTIPAQAFKPKPKIESSFVRLTPHQSPPVHLNDEELFFRLIRKAFSQRRKTLWNNLKTADFLSFAEGTWESVFRRLNLDQRVRAQDLSLESFALLCNTTKVCLQNS